MATNKKSAKKATAKKRPVKKAKATNLTGIAAKILADQGEKWVKKTCGTTEPTTPEQVATLVYNHFLESDLGKETWDAPGQNEGKVDYISDSIYDRYIHDLEWMTSEEWMEIVDDLYNMVYEGVF